MKKFEKLIIYSDGGARGNPGPAGIGVVIFDEQGKAVKGVREFLGEKTNNEAEYEGVIRGLREAAALGAEVIEFRLDSELVQRQLNGIYKIKTPHIQELFLRVRNLETKFKKVVYQHVPREQNSEADKLVNKAIDEAGG